MERGKYINLIKHFAHKTIQNRQMRLIKVDTSKQLAALFTKALPLVQFFVFIDIIIKNRAAASSTTSAGPSNSGGGGPRSSICSIQGVSHVDPSEGYLRPSLLEGPSRHQLEFEHPSQGSCRPSDPARHTSKSLRRAITCPRVCAVETG